MRKAGQLAMTSQVLKNMLLIPDDTNIRNVRIDHERDLVYILLEDGEWLPDTPEGQEPIQVVVTVEDNPKVEDLITHLEKMVKKKF